jgi:S-formylglutathione hydrolase FrmB
MEDVIGDGGQLHSFEAVFSPLDPNGRPRPLYNRQTGAVDPEVAEAWQAYDITIGLRRRAPVIGASLRGKVHVYTGEIDTFYLEGAVAKLKEAVNDLGIDPSIEIFPGKDHGNILDTKLAERLDAEMHEAVKD